MNKSICIEPHYLGSIEYMGVVSKSEIIQLEVHQHFNKQTYKNRCEVLSPQGCKSLTVPVHYGNRTPLKEVKIDYAQSWQKVHLGMMRAAYGKSAFFDFYYPELEKIISSKPVFLLELTISAMEWLLFCLSIKKEIKQTTHYQAELSSDKLDIRETILPKKAFNERHFYQEVDYFQNFGTNFVPNLSVLDCLMNTGPECAQIVQESVNLN